MYIGAPVTVRLIRPQNGIREFTGVLSGYRDGVLSLALESGEQSFSAADCAYVRLVDDFDMETI